MKKTLKVLLLVAFMAVVLFALTGCGDKLVATKETEDATMGNIEEKIEFTFKKDKLNTVKMTYKFEDKETAEEAEKDFNDLMDLVAEYGDEELDVEVKRNGKKLTIKLDASTFASMEGEDVEISKDELKEELEDEGYKVK